jgi:carbonic anhydrase
MGVSSEGLEALEINDPYKAVEVDIKALRANPKLPGGFTVAGLVYDVATGKIETVVPPARLKQDLV